MTKRQWFCALFSSLVIPFCHQKLLSESNLMLVTYFLNSRLFTLFPLCVCFPLQQCEGHHEPSGGWKSKTEANLNDMLREQDSHAKTLSVKQNQDRGCTVVRARSISLGKRHIHKNDSQANPRSKWAKSLADYVLGEDTGNRACWFGWIPWLIHVCVSGKGGSPLDK